MMNNQQSYTAAVFQTVVEHAFETGGINITHPVKGEIHTALTYEIAALFAGRITPDINSGLDVITFPDQSFAVCGMNGHSLLVTGLREDHCNNEVVPALRAA